MKGLEPGQQVDQFRIVRELGKGGMSEVYLARDTVLGRKVALKLIRADFVNSPRRLKLFLREAQLTAKFAHPHIITIYSVGAFEGEPYLALEYLEGQTLEERMHEGAMSVPEAMRIGFAIARALEEAHSHGVLHRDLKPANVIIPKDGRLRVLDFGLSKILEDSNHPALNARDYSAEVTGEDTRSHEPVEKAVSLASQQWLEETVSHTTNELLGTPAYMPPERWLGEKVTGGTDVWALGAMFYEMLTAVHPFLSGERSVLALAKNIIFAQELPTFPQNIDVPEKLSQLITTMLDIKTSRRPSAKQVVHVLRGLLQRNRSLSLEKRSPFRGLLPFSERHADLFFGRNAEIEMALERLRHEPILPVVGPSGAGKSSFVSAGIVPRLRELDHWLVLKVRPGIEPFEALGSVIEAVGRGGGGNTLSPRSSVVPKFPTNELNPCKAETAVETQHPQNRGEEPGKADREFSETASKSVLPQKCDEKRETLWNYSDQGQRSASEGLAQKLLEHPARLLLELQALADQTSGNVLLLVDQLEELYTHENDPDLRRAYMEAISSAADDAKGPIRVIICVREDFLGRVAESPSARETLSRIMVLRTPGEKALFETVTKPVELAGYTYEDEGLPEKMLDSVRNAPSSLPILQFACSQLWNHRDAENRLLTRAAYEEMGGVEGALASKADDFLVGLTESQRNVARQLMLRLVTPEGTRRVITEQELFDSLDPNAAFVLNRLTAERMVVSHRAENRDNGEVELELVHDSLIHSWKPLVRWLEQSREEVVFLDEVSRAAELWDLRGRPREEVWSREALDEAKARIKRCEAVPKRVTEFLEAGELQRQARVRYRRKIVFVVIVTLLTSIAVLSLVVRKTIEQRDREQHARASALSEGARAAYTKGDYLEARSKLRGSIETRDSTQARALWWLLENEPLVWSKSLDSTGSRVSVSPNGRLVAVSSMYINIFDTKTLERQILSGHKNEVVGIDFSPNGRWLSSVAKDRDIRLWDLREETVKVLKGHTSKVVDAVFSPDGKLLVSGSYDNAIKVWDIKSGTSIMTLENSSRVRRLHFTQDGRFIISVHHNNKVYLWNAQSYQLEQVIEEPGMRILDAMVSSDGKLLAYGGSNGVLVVRDLKTQQEQARLFSNANYIFSVNFNSNSNLLASSTTDGRILVWDTRTWSISCQFRHSEVTVTGVSFVPAGDQLVSTGDDGTLKLWKTDVPTLREKEAGHGSRIYSLAFAPDGKTIATGSGVDGELRLWDVEKSESIRRIHGYDAALWDIAFNHNGKLLATGARDGSIRLYTLPEGQLLKTLYGHRTAVTRVLFTSDGTQLVSSSTDTTIAFWDLESLTLHKFLSTGDVVRSIDIAPNGRLLASASPTIVKVRDIETDKILQTFSGHTDLVFSVDFSPDGKSLYSSSFDSTVRRYMLGNTSTEGEIVARHHGRIHFIDISHTTEDILGSPSADGTAKIWKINTSEVNTLQGHRGEINSLRYSPDGTRVATVSDDTTLRLWDTITCRPLWRAPLMLEEPPLLLTEQGWISFEDDRAPSPSTKQWQEAVDARGKLASATADLQTLCLVTFDDRLEIWDIPTDRSTFETKKQGIQRVLSIRQGCLTLSDEILTLTKATGEAVSLGKNVEAMSRSQSSVLVLESGKLRILDLEGNLQDEFQATTGATALTLVEDTLALGFSDGRIEIWRRDGPSSERYFICREPEGNPVTMLIPGPPGTIIAGFQHGAVGIWNVDTGERLFSHRLHGPVIHLLLQDQKLYAATELGSRVLFDLHMFYIDYCDLMNQIWREVFWIWEEGRARYREIPTDHECRKRQ